MFVSDRGEKSAHASIFCIQKLINYGNELIQKNVSYIFVNMIINFKFLSYFIMPDVICNMVVCNLSVSFTVCCLRVNALVNNNNNNNNNNGYF